MVCCLLHRRWIVRVHVGVDVRIGLRILDLLVSRFTYLVLSIRFSFVLILYSKIKYNMVSIYLYYNGPELDRHRSIHLVLRSTPPTLIIITATTGLG